MNVQKYTITIDEDGTPNTVSNDRVTHVPAITKQPQSVTLSEQSEPDSTKDSAGKEVRDNDIQRDEYVFERIVRHIGEGNNLHYMVHWYGYGLKGDTVEPADHISQHFIARD